MIPIEQLRAANAAGDTKTAFEAVDELLALRELPPEMESADRFFTASCDCFEDGCDGSGKVDGEDCDLCAGCGEVDADSVGEETVDEIIARVAARDAQHLAALSAVKAERDAANIKAAEWAVRVTRAEARIKTLETRRREALQRVATASAFITAAGRIGLAVEQVELAMVELREPLALAQPSVETARVDVAKENLLSLQRGGRLPRSLRMTEQQQVEQQPPEQMIGAPIVCLLELERDGELCGCCETAIKGGTQVIAFATNKGPRAAHPLCFYRQRSAHLEAENQAMHQTMCAMVAARGGVFRVTAEDQQVAVDAKFEMIMKQEPHGGWTFRLKAPLIVVARRPDA